MGPLSVTLLVILLIIIALAVYVVSTYNGLVTMRNRFRNAFAQIDVQLRRRYDLIPNLVETAKGYLQHERETLEAVIAARNQAITAERHAAAAPDNRQAVAALAGAETNLAGAMGRFFALAESYPDLKANQTMMQLNEELASTENRIAFARQSFNDAVTDYNTACQLFPASIIASACGFTPATLLEIDGVERAAPKISFTRRESA